MKPCLTWPLLLASLLSGCGSYHTLRSDDVMSASDLRLKGTYCGAIPRVYGGVVWDACQLYGEPPTDTPSKTPDTPANATLGPQVLPVLDMVLSGVVDTLALPYTVYRQNRDGSIELQRD